MKRFTSFALKTLPPVTAAVILVLGGCEKKNRPVALFPLVSKEDLQIGGELYKTRCAICHGMTDKGNPPTFVPLANSALVKGDPLPFATTILYGEGHIAKPGDPHFFEASDDASIARIGNYLKAEANSTEVPMRAKTVRRARELHNLATTGSPQPTGPDATPPPAEEPAK
jgi:mono/diheme cytochrome c family protein